jgi:hypothetical protein
MTDFIRTVRDDGLIEYVNPRYDEIIARDELEPQSEPVVISDEEIAAMELRTLRRQRNQKIAETDWWANSDLTMTQAQTDYRQALRDITDTYSSYLDVVWPVKP